MSPLPLIANDTWKIKNTNYGRPRRYFCEEALLEAAYQVMWDHDFTPLISLKVFDAGRFATYQEKGFSFTGK